MLLVVGCGCSSPMDRYNKAKILCEQFQFTELNFNTPLPIKVFVNDSQKIKFNTFNPQNASNNLPTIYLEGDGLSLGINNQIAFDSSPLVPMALKLAIADTCQHLKLVIMRPYHYFEHNYENNIYWSTGRYSKQILDSVILTIQKLQKRYQFNEFNVVAYSGGATIAWLILPFFKINRVTTFAGNLDQVQWCKAHGFNPLTDSLDPLQSNIELLKKAKQIHYVGTNDDNTSPQLASNFVKKIGIDQSCIKLIEGFKHGSDWSKIIALQN